MNKSLIVKGIEIGKGKPIVCVPVVASEKEAIVAEVRKYVQAGVSMIEWRVDAFSQDTDVEAVKSVLAELKPIVENTILLFTYRTKAQGGNGRADKHQQFFLHEAAAKSGVVDFVDVEYIELKRPNDGVRRIRNMGVNIIASHHDFHETPDAAIISMILEDMYESGADIVKLALMPNDIYDVFTLMAATANFREEHPDKPIITMSMGPIGSISRVAGEYCGSCVTFGAGQEASAPGQLQFEDLEKVLTILSNSVNA